MTAETKVRVLYLGTPAQNRLRHMTFKGVNVFFVEEPVKCDDGKEHLALISSEIAFKEARNITERSSAYAIVVNGKVKDRFFNDTGDTIGSILPKFYDSATREDDANRRSLMSEAEHIIGEAQARAAEILAEAKAEAEEIVAAAQQQVAPEEVEPNRKTPRGKK